MCSSFSDPSPTRLHRRRGFTLVELLVVISIIGVLVAMVMPAVNSARESGRRSQCASNLHQMALGCLAHELQFGHLPSGGWSCCWAGEPDRGFGRFQPGGWHFNILPFIDKADLHDLGAGLSHPTDTPTSNTARMAFGLQQAQTPVAIFLCPTRHGRLQAFPAPYAGDFNNISDPGTFLARSDYAANAGSNFANDLFGNSANLTYSLTFDWTPYPGSDNSTVAVPTGVIYRASTVPMAWIKDGASNTFLIGERNLDSDFYLTGGGGSGDHIDNDQGWDQGYDYDTIRGTGIGHLVPTDLSSATPSVPAQDRSGVGNPSLNFGSAHEAGFNMAFCDGQVKMLNYDIDPVTYMQLGHRNDGEPTQLQNIDGIH
jgi:prepilin-type N-terminal cleavage/methylation domain-containing protein/prepilin-type processing-associated H-X9-DG protein